MRPISFHDFHPDAGIVFEWGVSNATAEAALAAPADPTPPSYNQQLHLRADRIAAGAGLPGNPWIGASFEIEGPADLDALAVAFTAWVRRHAALRSGFREHGPAVQRFTLPAEAIVLHRQPARTFGSPAALRTYLNKRFSTGTDPFSWPFMVLGLIDRPGRSTVYLALDHVAGDGFSLALAVWELQASYEAALAGREPELPVTGSFLDSCLLELEHGAALDADHPAVWHWREFVRDCGGTAPTFPLDLGVEPGQAWPQHVYDTLLLQPEEAARFEAACRGLGGGIFAGLLSAVSIAVRELTGRQEFRTITPLHTRHEPDWMTAMGWFITCAPVALSLAGTAGFGELLPRAQTSVRTALGLSRYPAARIVELLGDDFRVTRRELFSMVSYTDYRKLPGAERHPEWKPVTIGQVTEADDSHVWISRQYDGLYIAIRHPDTPTARGVLDEYTNWIRRVLAAVAIEGDYLFGQRPVLTSM